MQQIKNKSASGLTGIPYPLIKNVKSSTKAIFIKLANDCIKKGDIPKKWKLGLLYPIPKKEDWCYNLNNVRLILLFKTFRKTVVRIVNTRLDKILKEKDILKEKNFAGLPEESMASPLHFINDMLEEAKEKKKEIWIFFQDMKKAFDSVSLGMLRKALLRIKLPENITSFIMSIYSKREMEVITSVGLTQRLYAQDGIDQGEVILPLVWRIFYNPLLCKIQAQETLDFEIDVAWPTNLSNNIYEMQSSRIPVLAHSRTFV